MDKWEYKTASADAPNIGHEALNKEGDQGWELVTVYPMMPSVIGGKIKWVYIFKRRKPVILNG